MASGYPRGRDNRNRAHAAVQACRDCQRPMRWATNSNGTRIALDADPDRERGDNLLVIGPDGWAFCVQIRNADLVEETRGLLEAIDVSDSPDRVLELRARLYSCHWDTCPNQRPRERADLA